MRKTTFNKSDYDQFISLFINSIKANGLELRFTDVETWIKEENDPEELMDFQVISKEYVPKYMAQKAVIEILNCFEAKKYIWYLIEIKVPCYKDGFYIQQFKMGAK